MSLLGGTSQKYYTAIATTTSLLYWLDLPTVVSSSPSKVLHTSPSDFSTPPRKSFRQLTSHSVNNLADFPNPWRKLMPNFQGTAHSERPFLVTKNLCHLWISIAVCLYQFLPRIAHQFLRHLDVVSRFITLISSRSYRLSNHFLVRCLFSTDLLVPIEIQILEIPIMLFSSETLRGVCTMFGFGISLGVCFLWLWLFI